MITLLEYLLGGAAVLLLVPSAVVLTEVVFAAPGRAMLPVFAGERPRTAILVPAHNEASIIADTLRAIVPQLAASDRLLVVADNCSDDTAAIAAAHGAESIVRSDSQRRGKGYALDFGVRHLELNAPDIVVVIDADCVAAPGSIDHLVRVCRKTGRPVQALYLMLAPKNATPANRIAEFAWTVKNRVRPLGLHRLGLPCQLMGTGMAFPWPCISKATLATGHIVEDLKLGIDLARAGTPPLFCAAALVTSQFPASGEGIQNQRARWEHGYLSTILSEAPRLLRAALAAGDANLFAMALDLSVPPLALLLLLVAAVWSASLALYVLANALLPISVATLAACMLLLSVLLSWGFYGRRIVSLGTLALALVYALRKVPLYVRFLVSRQMSWVRSKRDTE